MRFDGEIKRYLDVLRDILKDIDGPMVDAAIEMIQGTKGKDSTVYILGNGGSATTASHLTCDFNKGCGNCTHGQYDFECLCDNVPTMMAYANDCGYENVFLGQLKGKLRCGDLVFCISGSGNSINVIKAAQYARQCNCKVITMTGFDGGELIKLSDCPIHIPIRDMQKVEDCHLIIGHMMAQILMK